MDLVAITCPKCGGSIKAPSHGKGCYCTFCGTQLLMDDGSKTVTYRTVDEALLGELELERERMRIEESHRPFRVKAALALFTVGMAMIIVGCFAGSASGDSNSPWYMVAMMGLYAIIGAFAVWYFGTRRNRRGR